MRRVFAACLSVCLAICLAACGTVVTVPPENSAGSNSLAPPADSVSSGSKPEETAEEALLAEQVLYEREGIRITAKELSKNDFGETQIKLLLENDSEAAVTVQVRNMSVNGYMCDMGDVAFSSDVAAGKKVNDSIDIADNLFERCGIEIIAEVDLSFHIFDSDSWDTIDDSEQIHLTTSANERYTQIYDDSGTVLIDQDGIRIVYRSLEKDSIFGNRIVLYVENNTEQPFTIQQRDMSVNGFMVDGSMSTELMPGTKSVTDILLYDTALEENGIETLEDCEVRFHVFNTESWDVILETEPVVIDLSV